MANYGKQVLAVLAVLACSVASATYSESGTIVKLIRADEFKSKTTYWATPVGYPVTSYTRSTGSKHLLELRFKWGSPSGSSGGGGGTTPVPEDPVPVPTVAATATTNAVVGGGGVIVPPTPQTRTFTEYYISVVHAGMANEVPLDRMGMSANGTVLPVVSSSIRYGSNTSDTGPGLTHTLAYNDEVGVHVISDAAGNLPGKLINVVIRCRSWTEELQNGQWVMLYWSHTGQRVTYDCDKMIPLHVASIDSRRCYGQPNSDGALMADPNADLRNPAFPDWTYKGGLFVGNMPWQTGDQSGLARCQMYFDLVVRGLSLQAPEPRIASLACLDMGSPSSANGSLSIGVYKGISSLSAPYRFTWENKWTIAPRSTPSTPPDHTYDPWSSNTFTSSTATQEFVNWLLTDITADSRQVWLGGGLVMAIDSESSFTGTAWRYFASPAYQALFPSTAILSDCQPRVWMIWSNQEQSWSFPSL